MSFTRILTICCAMIVAFSFATDAMAQKRGRFGRGDRDRGDNWRREAMRLTENLQTTESEIRAIEEKAGPMKEQLTELKAALDEAKKESIEANKQVPITLKETGQVKKELYEKLNERSDIKPAADRFKAAEKKLQAAIEATLKRLRTGLRYTKLKLDKEEVDETLAQKRSAGALPNELQPLAQKKLSFESKIKDMEAKALEDDAEYRKAKDEYDDAQAAYLKARNAHEKTVLEDPELIAAQKKQVDAVKAQKDARVKVSKLTAQYSSARRKAGVLDSQYAAKKKELASLNSRKESLERQAKRYLKDRD